MPASVSSQLELNYAVTSDKFSLPRLLYATQLAIQTNMFEPETDPEERFIFQPKTEHVSAVLLKAKQLILVFSSSQLMKVHQPASRQDWFLGFLRGIAVHISFFRVCHHFTVDPNQKPFITLTVGPGAAEGTTR